jgi:hypothetical protein
MDSWLPRQNSSKKTNRVLDLLNFTSTGTKIKKHAVQVHRI